MSEPSAEPTPNDEAPGNDQEPDAGKTFTQEELNRIVADRVTRVKNQYSDYSQLKAAAKELESVRNANKSEQERIADAARSEGAQSAMQKAHAHLIQSEARALAAAAKFRDPSDAVAFLGDLSSVAVGDDFSIDTKALQASLNDLAKNKPYLLAEEKPTRPTGDAGQGPRGTSGPANMNDLIRQRMQAPRT